MIYKVLSLLDRVAPFKRLSAHCDIPCGIYDPHAMEIAALTVIRMIDLMTDLDKSEVKDTLEGKNTLARCIAVKEEHAEIVKREVRVIWGDYFKQNHIDQYPELPGLVHQIMQLGSKGRQTVSREQGLELLNQVNRFAEIFWATKGFQTKRVKAPYKPEEEMVHPVL